MSTYKSGPKPTAQSVTISAETSAGPDQAFTKMIGNKAGAKRGRGLRNSTMDIYSGTNSMICDSYKNVDFFAIKEPYQVVKNRYDARSPLSVQLPKDQIKAHSSLGNPIRHRQRNAAGSLGRSQQISSMAQYFTGNTNSNQMKPLYHMTSQPSQAHISAVDLVENLAVKTLEAEIKRIVERPEHFNAAKHSQGYD